MKLSNVKVLDLSVGLPGPMLAGLMADHSADVIKVEPPGGDFLRASGAGFFGTLNRGKRNVVLNLKQENELTVLRRLIGWADILVESFRPGTAGRLGFGYEQAQSCNPGLVYCSISGFGQDGPLSAVPAHDLAVQAYAGAIPLSGAQAVRPGTLPTAVCSALAGLSGVLMALLRARETGIGDYLDIAMLDAMLPTQMHRLDEPASAVVPAMLDIYEAQDGRWVALGGREPKFAAALLDEIGRSDLLSDAVSGEDEAQSRLAAVLRDAFRTRGHDAWRAWAATAGVPLAPVLSFEETLRLPHVTARAITRRSEAGELQLTSPLRFQREPARYGAAVPTLPGDLHSVLQSLDSHRAPPTPS